MDFPGFPGGKPCPRCLLMWGVIIVAAVVAYRMLAARKEKASNEP